MITRRRRPKRWSDSAGSYSSNAFAIQLPATTRIIDPSSLELLPDDPDALAVLIHEYWHYLQNLTTIAGFISFVLQQDFVSSFSSTVSPAGDGTSLGTDALGDDIRE